MSVGNAVLDVILEPDFLKRVALTGLLLKQRLAELKDRFPGVISEIRGEGLMMGIRMVGPNTDFVAAARAHHLLCIAAGDNVVRLLPPLVISDSELTEGCRRLEAACVDLAPATAAQQRGAA
jgi:acetylornithine/N-succinyldiaminopimelate aminotransferase